MAITVSQQPEDYTPCYNKQIFVALSNQVGQPNFSYTIDVTDLITTVVKRFQVAKRPDNYLVFDASTIAKTFMEGNHYLPKNEYGWQQATGVRKIRVNIGETYGALPAYTAGTNIDYIVWNGVIDYKDFPTYDPSEYVYTNPSDIVYLTPGYNDVAFEDRSNYLYALTTSNLDVDAIRVRTFDSGGNQINNSLIANPWTASTTYTDKYICIDIGHKGLTNIASGDVSGSYPILTSGASYYDVYDRYISGFGGGGAPIYTETLLKRYYINCECKHDVYTVHFLAKNGRFETIHFSKKSEVDIDVTRTHWRQLQDELSGGTYTYDGTLSQERVLSSESQEKLRLNTDFLSQDQTNAYKEIIDSPVIYLDMGSSTPYMALNIVSNSYRVNRSWNEKLFSLSMDFEYGHVNHRQT